ncbi:hypothetical protein GCM10025868_20940 [Angustibacter aerolatus]|uniref:ABC-type glycine betaine transport system substrate-binding domain-containing protein n=1 Tax=Angustibacter aerolatus TaxID=1162965 RepID=A0ABQ6JHK1_9ACTN|nr:extracellular solute-binding protein [Angustibacter aerolatus]GMA86844.1 hypothetical protein GCM10025868_20940 [Angustibacter aerolatus]
MTQNPRLWRTVVTSGLVASALVAAGCAGAGGGGSASGGGAGGGDAKSINVLMVSNPQMTDIQRLTADTFTKDTGIKVNYTVLDENSLRDKVTQDVATKAGQYDVATVGAYEIPIWAKNGWLHEVGAYASKDASLRPVRPAEADPGGHRLRRQGSTACRSTASPRCSCTARTC